METPIIKDPHPINRLGRPPTNKRKSTREKIVAKYFRDTQKEKKMQARAED